MLVIASACAGVVAYNAAWLQHCAQLKPSLIAHLINTESRSEDVVYFALGHPADAKWTTPSSELLEKIDLKNVLPENERRSGNVIFFVGDINWIDWGTVIVDYGFYRSQNECSGTERATLHHTGEEWTITENGTLWIATDDGCG